MFIMQDIISTIEKEKQTIAYYNSHAQEWAANHGYNSKVTFWKEELDIFQHYLPTGSILEIGSGGGKEAAELINRGYEYTGIDASQELIKMAQARLPKALFIEKNVYDLDFPQASFDGFWCAAMLLHISKDTIDNALENIKKVIKPGGIGFISVKEGLGEHLDKKTGRWFFLYSSEQFIALLHKHGFAIRKQGYRKQNLNSWLTFFVQK